MRLMFERHGLGCITFAGAEPALEWLRSSEGPGHLGAALVDWQLDPGRMDGLACMAELKKLRVGLPCFLVSAFADHALRDQAKAAGAAAFIPKPITWVSVQAALQMALAPEASTAAAHTGGADRFDGTLALLAEDNKQNQLVAKVLLKKLGIELDIADNGRVALEKVSANSGKYQLILMDMQMPEMDGLEATRRIRALHQCQTIPILAMTANAMKADLDACMKAGMNGFVTKPIDKVALLAELRKVLGKEKS